MSDGERDLSRMFRQNEEQIIRPIGPANVQQGINLSGSFDRARMASSEVVLPELQKVMNPQEPIDVLGTKIMGSINLIDDMKQTVPQMQIEKSDIATLGESTMKMGGELLDRALNIFGGDEPEPDPVAELERKLENNVRTPPPAQIGMGIGGGPGG